MKTHWVIITVFVLVAITLLIFLLKKNQKDRKNLFKKLAGEDPYPPDIKSEFDSEANIK
jgi:uncharacterized integral membrane protein